MTREEWSRLPMELRERWWDETDYGKRPPSPELAEAIEDERRHPERIERRRQERQRLHERLAQEAREQAAKGDPPPAIPQPAPVEVEFPQWFQPSADVHRVWWRGINYVRMSDGGWGKVP
jgi:hypothetical protein